LLAVLIAIHSPEPAVVPGEQETATKGTPVAWVKLKGVVLGLALV
jgi:hypothetical protein